MGLLEAVRTPFDLRGIPKERLPELAAEIRSRLIEVVSANGGHLAPSLGVVELTIALHRVYEAPADKIVWDVSHQSYAHKLLTGRNEAFSTLRRQGGISGFTNRSESPYDVFTVGHAGASIATALGLALARDRRGEPHEVVAIIGDGSMTSGLAYEALNQAGCRATDLTVVLNDNTMSISPNVGAISGYLSRTITGKRYMKLKQEIQEMVKGVPRVGESLVKWGRKIEESVKGLIAPGMLFEELGFKYVGPIDGHNLDLLLATFENVRAIHGPVLVHVITTKGKGYEPAEQNPTSFHGIGPFDIETGDPIPSPGAPPSYTSVFGRTIVELAKEDPSVVGITAAMPDGTGLSALCAEMPERFFDLGIAEQGAVAVAAGLAAGGYHPVVAIYSTFFQRCFDNVVHDVCLQDLPVTFCLDRGGLVGEDGPTHHGVLDLSFLRCVPNLVLAAPADEEELRRLLATALAYPHPMTIRYPRGSGYGVPLSEKPQPYSIGEGTLLREGNDLLIVAAGSTVHPAVAAAEALKDAGIDAAVINARFIKPLPEELILEWAVRCGRVLVVEENSVLGGLGGAIAELASDRASGIQVHRLGIPDRFIEHASIASLRAMLSLDAAGIAGEARELLKNY
jgi:1-deoxy-D-xylulose-5-phosphate synthase